MIGKGGTRVGLGRTRRGCFAACRPLFSLPPRWRGLRHRLCAGTLEFGSTKTRAGFADLNTMDAYVHIKDGTRYPAVMGVTGINDPRVSPWQVAKFIARLQQASASGCSGADASRLRRGARPARRLSRAQTVSVVTDEFSFLLWQCRSPQFAAIPTRIATAR